MNPIAAAAMTEKKHEEGQESEMQAEDDAHQLLRAVAEDAHTSDLFRAVARSYVEEVRTLLEGGAAANERNYEQETPLHYAALSGDLEIAQLLVEHGARVKAVDRDCRTPLFRAVDGGHQHVVTWLVKLGTPVDQAEDVTGWTALFWAAEKGDLEMVKLLVRLGAKIDFEECDDNDDEADANEEECDEESDGDSLGSENDEEAEWEDVGEDDDGYGNRDDDDYENENDEASEQVEDDTFDGGYADEQEVVFEGDEAVWKSALIGAVKRNQLHVVKWLVKNGAQVNLSAEGTCALVCAVQAGNFGMVQFLLNSGALPDSKNDRGRTPLFFAAHQGDVETLQLLIQHGARLDEKDAIGRTTLSLAASEGNIDMVQLLVENGAAVDEIDVNGKSALFAAAAEGQTAMVTFLLSVGASIDLKDNDGRTSLFNAALKNDEAVVGYLLDHGANIDASDTSGATPLSGVVQTVSTETLAMVQYLLRNSASVNVSDNQGWTPMMFAAKQGDKEIVDALIASGADVNQTSAAHETALMIASLGHHVGIFKSIIDAGVSVTGRRRDGETPLVSAARCDYFAGIQTLIKRGDSVISSGSEDETPLIPGTLEAMEALCLASNEFKPIFEGVVKRLQQVYAQMHAAQVGQATIISFATILFRLCHLLLKCQLACPVLRYAGSRTISARVQAFHEEIDHFMAFNEFDSADLVHVDWKMHWGDDWKQQRIAFAVLLQDDEALLLGLRPDDDVRGTRDRLDAVARLGYELLNCPGQYTTEEVTAIEQVMARLQRVANIENAPLPPWYISDDEVDAFERTHKLRTSGMWLKTRVMVASSPTKVDKFEANASRWFPLSHPNVAKLYGACHTCEHTFFVYEFCLQSSLCQFLGLTENRQLTWVKLHEIARGVQYLHQRNIVHGDLRCDNFFIGADMTAKIGGFGEEMVNNSNNGAWKSAELFRGDSPSFASDIYALGMSILEAATLESPWKERYFMDFMMDVKRGRLPPRPKDLDSSAWEIVKKMCAFDPDERVKITYVVQQLEAFAGNQLDNREVSTTELANYDMKTCVMPTLGATIESTLQAMQMAVVKFPESQQIAEQVLAKLTVMYDRLLSSQKSAGDIEVTKYCDVLSRFQRYLQTPASEISVARFARSRKIADSNHLFRSDLDHLMDLLVVSESDSLRSWGSAFEVISEEDGDESVNVSEEKERFDAIRLVNFKSSSIEEGSLASSLAHSSAQPWFLPLSELIFNESNMIGEGAFGAVYKGTWLDTPVVVKFMGYEEDHGKSSTRLFLHEVNIWHQLNHPHVVKLYGASYVGKRYFVCEYVSNGSLPDFLKRPENSIKTWQKLYEAALGLEYLHGLKVIHNDLKCDNILIGADGRAKLIDFGLSSIPDVAEIQVDVKRMGALHWKSPEYLVGERPAFTSDIYSLAMCILEVVTGDIPWGRNMNPTMVKLQVKKGRLPARPVAMGATQWNLLELMTKHDPKQRVKIAFVVDKLHELAQEEASAGVP